MVVNCVNGTKSRKASQMMFPFGRILIPFNSLPSKSRKFEMFAYSDFKMPLSFAIIGSITASQPSLYDKQ